VDIQRTPSPSNRNLAVPSGSKHSRSHSESSTGSKEEQKKQKTGDWGDFFTISAPASNANSPAHRSPTPQIDQPPAPSQHPAETGLHAETWQNFYNSNFYTGGEFVLPRATTPSDLSSTGAEWHRIRRPDVEEAFKTLELYDDPHANAEKINAIARELLLEYHPDKVSAESRDAATKETDKIIQARDVALAYANENGS